MTRTFIDAETGELFTGVSSFRTADQEQAIKKKQEQDKQKEQLDRYHKKSDKNFNFVEMEQGLQERDSNLNKLTNKQLGYFLVLQTYTDYNNMLRRKVSTLPMRKSDIRQAVKLSDSRAVNNLLTVLEDLEIIRMEIVTMYGKEHKAYFVNDLYSFKKGLQSKFSRRKTSKAVKLFTEDLQELYSQKAVKPADIGFIYKCIDFVHYDTNFLVFNPNEKDRAFIEPHTRESLMEAVNMSAVEIGNKLGSLKYPVEVNGEKILLHVFAKVKVGCNVTYKINPLLVYRKNGEPDPAEYTEFVMAYYRDKNRANKSK